jgi:hypothetical protein
LQQECHTGNYQACHSRLSFTVYAVEPRREQVRHVNAVTYTPVAVVACMVAYLPGRRGSEPHEMLSIAKVKPHETMSNPKVRARIARVRVLVRYFNQA